MIELRPLLIVSGTTHVESDRPRTDKDRKAGNVVAAGYFRRTRELTILHTPWGRLVDPANLVKVKDVIAQATIDVAKFNRRHSQCRVENTLVWEHLRGNTRDAVIVWVDRKLREGDAEVRDAMALLTIASSGAGAAA